MFGSRVVVPIFLRKFQIFITDDISYQDFTYSLLVPPLPMPDPFFFLVVVAAAFTVLNVIGQLEAFRRLTSAQETSLARIQMKPSILLFSLSSDPSEHLHPPPQTTPEG